MGMFHTRQAPSMRTDAELIAPRTIDEARLQMCAQLHRAVYGDVWARPDSPERVWTELLDRVERAARALRHDGR